MPSMDRRFWDRSKSEGIVRLTGSTHSGEYFAADCAVTDFSEEGLGLRTNQSFSVPSLVHVIIGNDTYQGEVRYCRRNPLGYYAIGIRITMSEVEA